MVKQSGKLSGLVASFLGPSLHPDKKGEPGNEASGLVDGYLENCLHLGTLL